MKALRFAAGFVLLLGLAGCGGSEQDPAMSVEERSTTSTEKESPPATITDITVDELLDKLNAPRKSGLKVGDQFRFTGELFQEDLWFTGATGEYQVLFTAQGGKQDLPVFVDKSDAAGWHNGTKVEMVVRNEERTINDETSDGWLNAVSVKTLSGATATTGVAATSNVRTVPNMVGADLQDAQDAMQAAGFYKLTSHDAAGADRSQVVDRNWKVCDQTPPGGTVASTDTRIDFGAVKDEESCP